MVLQQPLLQQPHDDDRGEYLEAARMEELA
jgi:hypothetical protein